MAEQGQRIDGVVAPEGLLVAVQIKHRHQKAGNAQAIGNRQALEVLDRCHGLPQGAGQLQPVTEHRGRGLQTGGRPEGAGGEFSEHIGEPKLIGQRIDVGVIPPKAPGARFEGFTAGGAHRRPPRGIRHPVNQGDANTGFTEGFGCTPAGPASADHHHMGGITVSGLGKLRHRPNRDAGRGFTSCSHGTKKVAIATEKRE